MLSTNGAEQTLCETSQLKIKGGHNIENVLASLCVASIFGISSERIMEAVKDFEGLEHRFEYVTSIDSVDFINDSKSTTVLSTMRALEACDKPVILIAGGKDKGSDFRKARSTIAAKVRSLVLIGTSKEKVKEHLRGIVPISEANSMDEAVKIAYFKAEKGDTVLLSPMCASFDMFRDFEERGKIFKEAVFKIKNGYFNKG
jgi:UDP-N-acetylmuramoylalanine--D-glutamate ligase